MCARALNTFCPSFCPFEACASWRLPCQSHTWRCRLFAWCWDHRWGWNCAVSGNSLGLLSLPLPLRQESHGQSMAQSFVAEHFQTSPFAVHINWNSDTTHAFIEQQSLAAIVDVYVVVLPLHTHHTQNLFRSMSDGQCADVSILPLYTAVAERHPDTCLPAKLVQELLPSRASATATVSGDTPLHVIAVYSELPCVQLALDASASVGARNCQRDTFLVSASDAGGHPAVISLLNHYVQPPATTHAYAWLVLALPGMQNVLKGVVSLFVWSAHPLEQRKAWALDKRSWHSRLSRCHEFVSFCSAARNFTEALVCNLQTPVFPARILSSFSRWIQRHRGAQPAWKSLLWCSQSDAC